MQAYDKERNKLDLHFEAAVCADPDGVICRRFIMRNTGNSPVRPALVKLYEYQTGEKSLHLFKPGMQKPSDTSHFYTVNCGEDVPYVNTWRGEWLGSFGNNELLISSMSCLENGSSWKCLGFSTFEAFHGLIVFRSDDLHGVVAEAWLETEEILVEPGETVELEELVEINKDDFNTVLDAYVDHLAAKHGTAPNRTGARGIAGWSDWEFYRNDKNSDNIMASADAMSRLHAAGLPFDTIVVDGGWAKNLAEWTETADAIPEGIEKLLDNISKRGLRSGLWFAPYIVNTACKLVKEHPEWLLRDKDGNILHGGGSNVGPKCTIDYSVPGTMEHLKSLLELFKSYGLKYLKLDGPVLIHYNGGRFRDPRSTRFKQIRATLKLIREVCPDIIIESEGVYGPAVGIADCHRVTQDEHPYWVEPASGLSVVKLNSVTNLFSSAWNRKCWSNVNMLALRDFPTTHIYYEQQHAGNSEREDLELLLTENELTVYLTSLVISGSTLFLSSPVETVSRNPGLMKKFGRMLPFPSGVSCEPVDTEKEWPEIFRIHGAYCDAVAVFNWGEEYRNYTISACDNDTAYEYWSGDLYAVENNSVVLNDVPPRCAKLIWLTGENGMTLAGTTVNMLGTGMKVRKEDSHLEITAVVNDTSEQKMTVVLPERHAVEKVTADFVASDSREEINIPVLVDNRDDKFAILIFKVPGFGKITFNIYSNKR